MLRHASDDPCDVWAHRVSPNSSLYQFQIHYGLGKITWSYWSYQQRKFHPIASYDLVSNRKADLLLLVLVLLEWLWAALDSLSHQCLSCHLSSVESIHLLFQVTSFLLQGLLFLLVHPLELLKSLVELEVEKNCETKLPFKEQL